MTKRPDSEIMYLQTEYASVRGCWRRMCRAKNWMLVPKTTVDSAAMLRGDGMECQHLFPKLTLEMERVSE